MLFVGLTARQVAQARLARAHDLSPPTADRLRRAFGTEAVIGVVVLGLSGWLLSFTPAKLPDEQRSWTTPSSSRSSTRRAASTSPCRSRPARSVATSCGSRCARPSTGLTGLTVDFVPPAGSGQATISQVDPAERAPASPCRPTATSRWRSPGAWTMEVERDHADRATCPAPRPTFDVLQRRRRGPDARHRPDAERGPRVRRRPRRRRRARPRRPADGRLSPTTPSDRASVAEPPAQWVPAAPS